MQSEEWLFVFMYLSKDAPLDKIVEILADLLNQTKKSVLIAGDMNWDYPSRNNCMKKYLMENGFSQQVEEPTHVEGSLLDHVYLKIKGGSKTAVNVVQRAKYYSDHDALFVKIKNI